MLLIQYDSNLDILFENANKNHEHKIQVSMLSGTYVTLGIYYNNDKTGN